MSVNYAAGLSYYPNKGKCGEPELFDPPEDVESNIQMLTEWIRTANHVVVYTGAGVSTSCGIPDFRGPRGVWTLEEKGQECPVATTFDDACPTFTHMALCALEDANIVKYLVTQNIDGLHGRSGFPRDRMSEIHGNVFVEECVNCRKQFYSFTAVPTVGLKLTGRDCPADKDNGRPCRGKLRDTILDWEDNLPPYDLVMAEYQTRHADLVLVLGSSLQIIPAGNMPFLCQKNGGKVAIVNLQKTKHDLKADLVVHAMVDEVLAKVLLGLRLLCPPYCGPSWSLESRHGPLAKPKSIPPLKKPILPGRKCHSEDESDLPAPSIEESQGKVSHKKKKGRPNKAVSQEDSGMSGAAFSSSTGSRKRAHGEAGDDDDDNDVLLNAQLNFNEHDVLHEAALLAGYNNGAMPPVMSESPSSGTANGDGGGLGFDHSQSPFGAAASNVGSSNQMPGKRRRGRPRKSAAPARGSAAALNGAGTVDTSFAGDSMVESLGSLTPISVSSTDAGDGMNQHNSYLSYDNDILMEAAALAGLSPPLHTGSSASGSMQQSPTSSLGVGLVSSPSSRRPTKKPKQSVEPSPTTGKRGRGRPRKQPAPPPPLAPKGISIGVQVDTTHSSADATPPPPVPQNDEESPLNETTALVSALLDSLTEQATNAASSDDDDDTSC